MSWRKVIGIAAATLGTAFVATSIVAKLKKKDSQYENEPEQKNPMEGKKVVFVEDENDKENADGKKGHLEAVGMAEPPTGIYTKYIKRGMDIILSFGGLVVLSPVLATIAIAIKIDDPGPVLFTQKRVGENKKYFKLHKFRSMKMCTPHDKPTHMLENPEQYITKVGKFIRAHSLDELPQIWDIFIGNMSVIGPRPGLWNQDFLTAERDKYGANDIKPGLTGWAQINGRDELEIEDKARLDGEYSKNIGLKMDAKCFLGSLHVIGGDDSVVEGGTGEMKKEKDFGQVERFEKEEIKVSVIMPAYNSEKYIQESIDSVLTQTYRNWELIIVDDCSKDTTFEIATSASNKDARIRVYKNKENRGVAYSRNVALDKAEGDYIAFLDSDDLWTKEKIKVQLSYMVNNDAAFSFTAYQKFDSDSKEITNIIPVKNRMSSQDIYYDTRIGCLTVMINRNLTGEFHMPLLNHMEDNITWQCVLARGYEAHGIDCVLALYRERRQSLTHSKVKAMRAQWLVYRKYYGFSLIKSASLFIPYATNAAIKHYIKR